MTATATKKQPTKPKAKPATKAAKPKPPTATQKTNWIAEKTDELDKQEKLFAKSVVEWDAAHAEAAEAKKHMELQQQRLNSIVQDIVAIRRGNFTPPLPLKGTMSTTGVKTKPPTVTVTISGAKEVDAGAKIKLAELEPKRLHALVDGIYREGVGLSEAQIETLVSAIDGDTVGDLERYQVKHAQTWATDIKGFGEATITKLQDACELVRRKFPMPTA